MSASAALIGRFLSLEEPSPFEPVDAAALLKTFCFNGLAAFNGLPAFKGFPNFKALPGFRGLSLRPVEAEEEDAAGAGFAAVGA